MASNFLLFTSHYSPLFTSHFSFPINFVFCIKTRQLEVGSEKYEVGGNEKSPPVDPAGTMTLGPKQLALFLSKCYVGYSVVLLVICILISLFLCRLFCCFAGHFFLNFPFLTVRLFITLSLSKRFTLTSLFL